MTDQKITMDGKWAYRHDPFTQVRVLCVDAGGNCPIASINPEGGAIGHIEGGQAANFDGEFDLVPLQEKRKPREVWAVAYKYLVSTPQFFESKDKAMCVAGIYDSSSRPEIIHFVEKIDEENILSEPTMEAWKEEDDRINMNVAAVIKQTTGWGE